MIDFLTQQPVTGARLRSSPLGRTLSAVSGSDGAFQLRGLVPGAAAGVEIEASGYNSLRRTVVTPPDGRTERRLFALVPEERGRTSKQKGVIGLVVTQDERDRVVVRAAPPGLPAANAGLSAGDAILSVDGLDVTEVGIGGVVTLLRGIRERRWSCAYEARRCREGGAAGAGVMGPLPPCGTIAYHGRPPMNPRLIMFDFDGTLADSFGCFLDVADAVADRYGFARLDRSDMQAVRALGARQIIQRQGVPLWKVPMIARHARTLMARDINRVPLFAGIDAALAELAAAAPGWPSSPPTRATTCCG